MAVDRLPGEVREFADYLDGLLARLDRAEGWSAVFWQRDPEGMRACLDGREVPPWDVMEALLEDLAAACGPAAAKAGRERARVLYGAALGAYDARPGAREVLADRLDVMLREQRYAAERHAELTRLLTTAASGADTDSLRLDLAWAHDDHARALARCAELRSRLEGLDRRAVDPRLGDVRGRPARTLAAGSGPPPVPVGPGSGPVTAPPRAGSGSGTGLFAAGSGPARVSPPAGSAPAQPAPDAVPPASLTPHAVAPASHGAPAAAPAPPSHARPVAPEPPRRRRRGSARFAGMAEDVAGTDPGPRVPVPAAPGPQAAAPRGARFAGGAEEAAEPVPDGGGEVDADAGAAVAGAVARIARLRAEGRSGEAHVLLVEVAQWDPARFPLLADALQRAGLGADWATLLWEAASLPVERLVGVAHALAAAGRDADGRQVLRQGVARPAEEVGAAVLRLEDEGRRGEARALLDACVRVRAPEEAARGVGSDPRRLVPLLLAAADAVSAELYWDLLHALRVAGHAL